MKKGYQLSKQEEEAMNLLGGFAQVTRVADRILHGHGFPRNLFTRREVHWIETGHQERRNQIEFHFDPGKSLRANIADLLRQAQELQAEAGGTNYVGATLQHLVGAKLDIVIGEGKITHHGFSVADHSTSRKGDYQIEAAAIHVTTHPCEALVRKCANNLRMGLKPVIITIPEAVDGADYILKASEIADRVDVLDVAQFLTANVYERSLFKAAECKVTLTTLLERYNAIVAKCETDPSLLIKLPT